VKSVRRSRLVKRKKEIRNIEFLGYDDSNKNIKVCIVHKSDRFALILRATLVRQPEGRGRGKLRFSTTVFQLHSRTAIVHAAWGGRKRWAEAVGGHIEYYAKAWLIKFRPWNL